MTISKIQLKVDGMYCPKCPQKVEQTLKEVEGTCSAKVNYETSIVEISYEPEKINPLEYKHIIEAIPEKDFKAEQILMDEGEAI